MKMKGRFHINAVIQGVPGKSLFGNFNFVRENFNFLCANYNIFKQRMVTYKKLKNVYKYYFELITSSIEYKPFLLLDINIAALIAPLTKIDLSEMPDFLKDNYKSYSSWLEI